MHKGMTELTGAPSWTEAWRVFVQPGDVVGIKMSPVGGRKLCSDPSVLHLIIDGIKQAGVPVKDIVVYERYRKELDVGYHRWLPLECDGQAAEEYETWQLGMTGYDRDVYGNGVDQAARQCERRSCAPVLRCAISHEASE